MAAKAKQAEAEAAEAAEPAEGEAAPKRKFSLKLILMVVAGLLVLGGGGAGGYMMFAGKKADDKPAAPVVKPAAFFDLPDVLVNLASTTGNDRAQFLKVKIVLEVPDQAVVEQIKPVLPRVMDAFQTYLRELRSTDLEGSAGLYRLKDELTRRVNVAIAPSKVNAVLFKEIVVQ
jgi:flagellar protein FliL